MIKLIILAIIAVAAFNSADGESAPLAPPAAVEPAQENPGFAPGWGCDHPDDTTGVKGRILAVPVDPAPDC